MRNCMGLVFNLYLLFTLSELLNLIILNNYIPTGYVYLEWFSKVAASVSSYSL